MSHHLDSPLSRQDPRLNLIDQFVFGTSVATVLVMDVNSSLGADDRPLGFHPEGRYEFKIHLDGEARESLTYRFSFGAPTSDGVQEFTLVRLSGHDAQHNGAKGEVLLQGMTDSEVSDDSGVRVYAGVAHEPFYLDMAVLKAVDGVVQHGSSGSLNDVPTPGENSFAGATVNSIVLEIPHDDVALHPGRPIGVWSATQLSTDAGDWRQINRVGLPMLWPIFRDDKSDVASQSNESHPADDEEKYAPAIATMVSVAVRAQNTSADPEDYGRRVAQRLTPDILPYVVGTPAALDFLGFNGRALTDNAPEVMFSLVTNRAVRTGLTAITPGPSISNIFPYVNREATSGA